MNNLPKELHFLIYEKIRDSDNVTLENILSIRCINRLYKSIIDNDLKLSPVFLLLIKLKFSKIIDSNQETHISIMGKMIY